MATAEDAEILTLCHEVASGPSSATRGPPISISPPVG
jgi:hypothetical protein